MTKLTLIERMERGKAPKSWAIEVKKMLRVLDAKDEKIEEYGSIIDALARDKENINLELQTAWYQIARAIAQLRGHAIESVIGQLNAYLRSVGHGNDTLA